MSSNEKKKKKRKQNELAIVCDKIILVRQRVSKQMQVFLYIESAGERENWLVIYIYMYVYARANNCYWSAYNVYI